MSFESTAHEGHNPESLKSFRQLRLRVRSTMRATQPCENESENAPIQGSSPVHKPATWVHRFGAIALATFILLLSVAATAQQPLVNLGLVGVGRVPADSFDAIGTGVDTMGGIFAGMTLDRASFSRSGSTYRADLYAQPDAGFGNGAQDYHNRVHWFSLSVTPYTGSFPALAQNQIQLQLFNTMLSTVDFNTFTGFYPNDTSVAGWPQSLASSLGGGHRSLDSQGVALTSDGGFFVADSYGPFVYHFDFLSLLEYELHPPAAYIPKSGPAFGSRFVAYGNQPAQVSTTDSGRYLGCGLVGLSLTPDGRKLVTILRAPLQQDGEDRRTSRNTRILVFDVNPSSPSFGQPVGEYVYELTLEGSEDHTSATVVTDVQALSDTDFLVLERDCRGLGGEAGPVLYKKVVRVDVRNATNLLGLSGTPFDLEKGAPGQISLPRSGLPSGVVAATRSDLVDLADRNQLARFGLNGNASWNANTISEKWESLGVIPLNDPTAPRDFLLLVGNDNDFKATTVYHNGVLVGANSVVVDSMMLAFRVGEDRVAPTLVCPTAPAPVQVGPGCTLPDVTGLVAVSDNVAGLITVTQSPASGTPVAQTPTQFTVVAVDQSGNQSQCSFFVPLTGPAPTIQCPGAVSLNVGSDGLVAVPNFVSGAVAAGVCGVRVTQDPQTETRVGPGTYSVTLTATDPFGQSVSCVTSFTALAPPPPPPTLVIQVTPSVTSLWPPNHKMVPVTVNVTAVGSGEVRQPQIVSVSSSEPVTSSNDTTAPDWQVTGALSLNLRAERADDGNGRVYTIQVRCNDAFGNVVTGSTTVSVPHDQEGTTTELQAYAVKKAAKK